MENTRYGWDDEEVAKRWAQAHRPGQARRTERHKERRALLTVIAWALVLWFICLAVAYAMAYVEQVTRGG